MLASTANAEPATIRMNSAPKRDTALYSMKIMLAHTEPKHINPAIFFMNRNPPISVNVYPSNMISFTY
jgi:hypothetical protein